MPETVHTSRVLQDWRKRLQRRAIAVRKRRQLERAALRAYLCTVSGSLCSGGRAAVPDATIASLIAQRKVLWRLILFS